MRKIWITTIMAAAVLSGGMVSCSGDDDSSSVSDNSATINSIVNTAGQGTWHITSFIDSGIDETDHFSGDSFTFGGNVVLTVTTPETFTGTWSVTDSNNSDDDSSHSDDIDFNILFTSAPPAYSDLHDDWEVLEVTATKIRLTDVSGGNGGTDFLTFERN